MTASRTPTTELVAPSPTEPDRARYRPGSLEIFGVILLLAIALRGPLESLLGQPALQSWATVFIAICVQATPFLVLGVVVSGAIAAFVPAAWFSKVLPDRPVLAVPVATACGAALPGCECGSVPISNRLMDRGVRPSASLAFMLSAPATPTAWAPRSFPDDRSAVSFKPILRIPSAGAMALPQVMLLIGENPAVSASFSESPVAAHSRLNRRNDCAPTMPSKSNGLPPILRPATRPCLLAMSPSGMFTQRRLTL